MTGMAGADNGEPGAARRRSGESAIRRTESGGGPEGRGETERPARRGELAGGMAGPVRTTGDVGAGPGESVGE